MDVHLLSAKVVVFLKNRNALRPKEKRPKEMHKKREREREREKKSILLLNTKKIRIQKYFASTVAAQKIWNA